MFHFIGLFSGLSFLATLFIAMLEGTAGESSKKSLKFSVVFLVITIIYYISL